MSSKYNPLLLSACLPLVAVAILSTTPAYAGFKWNAPEKTAVDTVIVEDEEPIFSPVAPPSKAGVIPMPSKSVEQPSNINLKEDIIWHESFNIIEGFGTDMPLALALRQIVPAKYAFSFGDGVNLGDIVSWKGGKPWNIVLEETLAPLNVTYSIRGNKLRLSNSLVEKKTHIIIEDIFIDDKTMDTAKKGVIGAEIDMVMAKTQGAISEQNTPPPVVNIILEPEKIEITQASNVETLKEIVLLEEKKNVELSANSDIEENPATVIITDTIIETKIIENTEDVSVLDEDVSVLDIDNQNNIDKIDPSISPTIKEDIKWLTAKPAILEKEDLPAQPKIIEIHPPIETPPIEIKATKATQIDPINDEVVDAVIVETEAIKSKPSNKIKIWAVKYGSDLREILVKWSNEEKVQLSWRVPNDYKTSKDIFISGTFKNAVNILISKGVKNPPKYTLVETPSYELIIEENAALGRKSR